MPTFLPFPSLSAPCSHSPGGPYHALQPGICENPLCSPSLGFPARSHSPGCADHALQPGHCTGHNPGCHGAHNGRCRRTAPAVGHSKWGAWSSQATTWFGMLLQRDGRCVTAVCAAAVAASTAVAPASWQPDPSTLPSPSPPPAGLATSTGGWRRAWPWEASWAAQRAARQLCMLRPTALKPCSWSLSWPWLA